MVMIHARGFSVRKVNWVWNILRDLNVFPDKQNSRTNGRKLSRQTGLDKPGKWAEIEKLTKGTTRPNNFS